MHMHQANTQTQFKTAINGMQRTQVYLPYDILEQVKEMASNQDKTMASIIRKIITDGLPKKK